MFQKLNVLDEHFDLQKQNVVELFRGPSDIAINKYPVVGGTPNSSYGQFNIALTPGSWLDPKAFIDYSFQVTVNVRNITAGNIAANPNVFDVRTDVSLTDYPFQTAICGVCDVQLNTKQVNSIDMNRYGKLLLELFRKKKDNAYSQGPSLAEDFYARVEDAYLTVANSGATVVDASDQRIPNGSWNNIKILSRVDNTGGANVTLDPSGYFITNANNWPTNTTVTLVLQVTGREALILPPFTFGGKEQCLFGINNLGLNFNYSAATIYRAFRSSISGIRVQGIRLGLNAPAVTLAGGAVIAADALSGFKMTNFILTLKSYQTPNMPGFQIPYPNYIKPSYQFYTNPVVSSSTFGTNSTVTSIVMNNVVSSGMPRAILLWCDKNNETYGQNYMKYYFPINKVNIGIGSKQNLLATFELGDLYELGREAGIKRNFLAYQGYAQSIPNGGTAGSVIQLVGSPLMLIPGMSFPLGEDITTNSDGTYTFTFTVDCNNPAVGTVINPAVVNPDTTTYPILNVMLVYDAWIKVDMQNLGVEVVRNPLSKQAPVAPSQVVSDQQVHPDLEGGAMLHRPNMYNHNMGSNQQSKLLNRIRK